MRTTGFLIILALTFLPGAAVHGQTAPSRDPAAPATSSGTGEIRGRVTDSAGKPLRRARITLDLIGGGSTNRGTTSTGLDGAYSFDELTDGRYRLTANRGGTNCNMASAVRVNRGVPCNSPAERSSRRWTLRSRR